MGIFTQEFLKKEHFEVHTSVVILLEQLILDLMYAKELTAKCKFIYIPLSSVTKHLKKFILVIRGFSKDILSLSRTSSKPI